MWESRLGSGRDAGLWPENRDVPAKAGMGGNPISSPSGVRRGAPADNDFWYAESLKKGAGGTQKIIFLQRACQLLIFVFGLINGHVMLCTYNKTQLTVRSIARPFHQLKTH
jgi:hypothetical protein